MSTLSEAVADFLAQKKIAVAGVSRGGQSAANPIYKKLRAAGYTVFATNPNADSVEGDPCYASLKTLPEAVDAVVVATAPEATLDVVREAVELGIPRLWMHRAFGQGSVSDEAVRLAEQNGILVIAGACPMMYVEPVDFGHKCFRWILGMTGKLPEPESAAA